MKRVRLSKQPEPPKVGKLFTLDDPYSLATDGYRLEVTRNEGHIEARVLWTKGAVTVSVLPYIIDTDATTPSRAEATRSIPLVSAMLDYLNAMGHPDRILELAAMVASCEPIEHPGYEFFAVTEQVHRFVYFTDDEGTSYEVVPDYWVEPVEWLNVPDIYERYADPLEVEDLEQPGDTATGQTEICTLPYLPAPGEDDAGHAD